MWVRRQAGFCVLKRLQSLKCGCPQLTSICHLNCSERKPLILLPASAEEGDRSMLGEEWQLTRSRFRALPQSVVTWSGLYGRPERGANTVFSVSCRVHGTATCSMLFSEAEFQEWPLPSSSPHLSTLRLLNQNLSCYLFIFDIKCADMRHALFFWLLNSAVGTHGLWTGVRVLLLSITL